MEAEAGFCGNFEAVYEKRSLRNAAAHCLAKAFRKEGCDCSSAELMHMADLAVDLGAVDLSELYSPARFKPVAKKLGLRPGFCVDLECQKPDGTYWDMNKPEDRKEMLRLLREDDPEMLIGSPPCTPFSALRELSKYKKKEFCIC